MKAAFAFTAACLALFGAGMLIAARPVTLPATGPIMVPTAPGLEVHEWAVFVIDASAGKINPDGVVRSTIPSFVDDHRYGASGYAPKVETTAVNQNQGVMIINGMVVRRGSAAAQPATVHPVTDVGDPSPVSVIRFVGSVDSKVDVTINVSSGSFFGSWPKAEERTNQLLWRDLAIADQANSVPHVAPVDSWFEKLRAGNSAFVSPPKGDPEKFLMYDVEMQEASPLKVKTSGEFSVELSNISSFPLHDVMLYRDGRQASVGELPVAAMIAKPATTSASTTPTTTASDKPAATAQLVTPPTSQPWIARIPWIAKMGSAGVSEGDQDLIERMLLRYARDKRMTAVYVMDDAQFDKLLPLEVVPQPAKIKRFGLVIIRNADPSAPTEIDDLIALLGNDDWAKRNAAYQALADMGPAATMKLTAAKNNSDLEVAWRAERLLGMSAKAN